ncbi:MAG: hypothetical protein WDM89_05015 [Rhizomicrobium sp.]
MTNYLVGFPTRAERAKAIREHRRKLKNFSEHKTGLLNLFRRCASGSITSLECYERLDEYWGHRDGVDDRLQGKGFTILGKHSNFQAFSKSVLSIVGAVDHKRDDVVREQIDQLKRDKVPTRRALLSEMLCLLFPDRYPILNTPVRRYRSALGPPKDCQIY